MTVTCAYCGAAEAMPGLTTAECRACWERNGRRRSGGLAVVAFLLVLPLVALALAFLLVSFLVGCGGDAVRQQEQLPDAGHAARHHEGDGIPGMCECGYVGHWLPAQPEYNLEKRCVHCYHPYPEHMENCVASPLQVRQYCGCRP